MCVLLVNHSHGLEIIAGPPVLLTLVSREVSGSLILSKGTLPESWSRGEISLDGCNFRFFPLPAIYGERSSHHGQTLWWGEGEEDKLPSWSPTFNWRAVYGCLLSIDWRSQLVFSLSLCISSGVGTLESLSALQLETFWGMAWRLGCARCTGCTAQVRTFLPGSRFWMLCGFWCLGGWGVPPRHSGHIVALVWWAVGHRWWAQGAMRNSDPATHRPPHLAKIWQSNCSLSLAQLLSALRSGADAAAKKLILGDFLEGLRGRRLSSRLFLPTRNKPPVRNW